MATSSTHREVGEKIGRGGAPSGGRRRAPLRFRPAARLQYLLSEQLVSDPNVAILEFVKNAYDADATDVLIQFLLDEDLEESSLIIADDGFGMDRDSFEQNWMHPGYSEKVDAPPTSRNRIPVGEKGLGRLAAGRLGATLDVYSRRSASARWFHAFFRWEDFNEKDKLLDQIPIAWDLDSEPPVEDLGAGTVIHIKSLSLKWDRRPPGRRAKGRAITRIGRLRQDLEVLLLPLTAGGQDFAIRLLHNSDLPEDTDGRVDDAADKSRSPIGEDNDRADSDERSEPPTTSPTGRDPRADVPETSGQDEVEEASTPEEAEGLVAPPTFELLDYEYRFELKRQGRGWRLVRTVSRSPAVAEQTGQELKTVWEVKSSDISKELDLEACGPLLGSFYYAPESAKAFRQLRVPTGVRIYRDGVRIDPYGDPGDDWLGASERKAVRQGHAAIQPNALYGAVAISRKDNPDLKPLANREGFVGGGALDAFFALARQEFDRFSTVIEQELLIPRWEKQQADKKSEAAINSRQWAVAMTRATAHAVRQPVTSAGAELRSLRQAIDLSPGIPDDLRAKLRSLHDNTQNHLARIDDAVGKMLGFLDVDPEPKDVDLVELVDEAVGHVEPDAQSCGIALYDDNDGVPIPLRTPAGLIEHALEELLENAIQAPRPEGREGWVRVRIKDDDGFRIEVADNAGGIDDKLRSKLFTQNVSRTGRIGVGLLINRQLMQIARGDIELTETGPEGSVFSIIFPR